MKMQLWYGISGLIVSIVLNMPAAAQHAVSVVSYDAGPKPAAGFTSAPAALGEPTRYTGVGQFPGAVTPFNPPYLASEIVSIGEGGHLTLRLSNYLLPQTPAPHLGVFTNAGFIETDFPNGQAGTPVGTFGGGSALVEVSENGQHWESLGSRSFDIPTNGYTDLTSPFSETPGNVPSTFIKPFVGTLADFDGRQYAPDMLDLLAFSGGGTWLDLSGTSLARIGFVRFSVPDSGSSLNFELDAVSVSRGAMGTATVPEPGTLAWGAIGCWLSVVGWRRRER